MMLADPQLNIAREMSTDSLQKKQTTEVHLQISNIKEDMATGKTETTNPTKVIHKS